MEIDYSTSQYVCFKIVSNPARHWSESILVFNIITILAIQSLEQNHSNLEWTCSNMGWIYSKLIAKFMAKYENTCRNYRQASLLEKILPESRSTFSFRILGKVSRLHNLWFLIYPWYEFIPMYHEFIPSWNESVLLWYEFVSWQGCPYWLTLAVTTLLWYSDSFILCCM